MSSTMRPEFEAGRLTPIDYIAALEAEVRRLQDTFEFARVQATENGIQAAALKEAAENVRTIIHRGTHPAGTGRRPLHVVKGD